MKHLCVILVSCCLFSCSSTRDDSLCGKWVSDATDDPLGMYLILSENGGFLMGDIDDGKEYTGVSGTWKVDKGVIILLVHTSESCKVQEGQKIRFGYNMIGDHELEISDPISKGDARRFRKQSQ